MKITSIILLTIFLFSSCNNVDSHKLKSINIDTTKTLSSWVFDKVKGQKLLFKNGKSFDTHLFGLKYIGQVPIKNKAPYLIFSGRECDECDADTSIYVHSPDDGVLDVEFGQHRLAYPGKEKDFESDTIVYQARAFYGQVLNNTQGVIWYEKRLLENNTWGKDIFLIDLSSSKRVDTMFDDKGQIEQTLKLLKGLKCEEIKGMDYSSEP